MRTEYEEFILNRGKCSLEHLHPRREKVMLMTEPTAAKATDDGPKPKSAPAQMVYGCIPHPCNGNEFVCEIVPTSCHNCGGTHIQFLRFL